MTQKYEYGIRDIRYDEIHRTNYTMFEAIEFMDPKEWDGMDPTKFFEIIRRPIGDWEPYDPKSEKGA